MIGLEIPWFPPEAAKQAHTIDTLYYVLIIVTVPIFVLVTMVVLFSVWRWRMRPGEERLDGPPIHGNTQLEVIWTALPSALIAALVVYAAVVLHDIGTKQPGELTIGVTGQQFEWSFSYPGYKDAQGQTIVTPDLYMQVNQPVVFKIHAVDVIHTFWVPGLPDPGGCRARHHDQLPRDARPARHLPDRLQPALRIRPLHDAHDAPHRHRRRVLHLARRARLLRPRPTASAAAVGVSTRHASKEGSQ